MPLEEGMATHPSILAWRIPWTKEPGGPQSMGIHRVRHNWSNLACCSCSSSLNWILMALLCGRNSYSPLTFREVKWRTSNPSCLTELFEQCNMTSAILGICIEAEKPTRNKKDLALSQSEKKVHEWYFQRGTTEEWEGLYLRKVIDRLD